MGGCQESNLKMLPGSKRGDRGMGGEGRGGPQGGEGTQRCIETKCVFTIYMSARTRDNKNESPAVESPRTESKCPPSLSWR